MKAPTTSVLESTFDQQPQEVPRIETSYRRIVTPQPAPGSVEVLGSSQRYFPKVNCYQPPVVWDRAEGFQVFDAHGNCWIDFSSTAVMTNTGHGHPAIRAALAEHVETSLLAQFSFVSPIRAELARRLLELAPEGFEKVYFLTVGSEAIECALRLVRQWGQNQDPNRHHVVSFADDYHGWTLGAHQLSGASAEKSWLAYSDSSIHRLPFPRVDVSGRNGEDADWDGFFEQSVVELADHGATPDRIAGVFIETLQGWGALPFPIRYMQRLRQWADEHGILLVFDEIQTGFGRTGRWFAHEHYGVNADLMCIGKGLTSSLPLAAVLGRAEVIDLLSPAEITTTHAAHPLCCAAALANLKVLEDEDLVERAEETGKVARAELRKLQSRWPDHISQVTGLGLLNAAHVQNPATGGPDPELARDWILASVRRGVMLFQTNRPTVKVCPPLVISPEAVKEGIEAMGEALEQIVRARG